MHALIRLLQVATALLVLWVLAWQLTGDTHALVRIGVYMAPFLLVAAVFLFMAALWLRRWVVAGFAASVTVVLAGTAPASLYRVWVSEAPATTTAGITLTSLSNRTANADMAATARLLRANRADIFVLQEIADPQTLLESLNGLYAAETLPRACWNGTYLIVSRFDLSPADRLPGNQAIRCQIDLPAGRAVIYSVHLPRAVRETADQRAAIAQLLADAMRQEKPVILAGDYNATPFSQTMRAAAPALVNAFDHVGRGPGFTFPTPARRLGTIGPFLRIDHVLVSKVLAPVKATAARWHPPGADHFPVEVMLQGPAPRQGAGPGIAMTGPRRAFVTVSAARAVTVVLVAVRAKAVALTLGPEGVGLLGLFTAAQDIGAQAADAGLSHSAVREISRAQDRPERLARLRRALAVAAVCMAFIGAMAMWAASPALSVLLTGSPQHSSAFALLAVGLFLTVLFRWRQAVLTGYRQVGALAVGGVLGSAVATAVGIAAIWIWSWDGLVWAAIAAPAAGLGAYLVLGRVPKADPLVGPLAPEWSVLVRLGVSLMLVAQIALIAPMALRVWLTHTGGLDDAGLFHAAWTVSAQIMAVLLVAVGVDFYPRISAAIANQADAQATLDGQLRLHLAAGGPALLLAAGAADWVLNLLYSADFLPATTLLQGLAVGSLARLVSAPLETVLTAAGRPHIVLGFSLIALVLLLAGTIAGTPAFGLAAIGIAYAAAQFTHLVLVAAASRRCAGIAPSRIAWLWLLGLAALGVGLTQLPAPAALGAAFVLTAAATIRTVRRDWPRRAAQAIR